MYFLSSRSDLNSLGRAINSNVTDNNYSSVGLFLQSDLHILSTVIGCIQDLLTKIVVGTYGNNEDSFYGKYNKTSANKSTSNTYSVCFNTRYKNYQQSTATSKWEKL